MRNTEVQDKAESQPGHDDEQACKLDQHVPMAHEVGERSCQDRSADVHDRDQKSDEAAADQAKLVLAREENSVERGFDEEARDNDRQCLDEPWDVIGRSIEPVALAEEVESLVPPRDVFDRFGHLTSIGFDIQREVPLRLLRDRLDLRSCGMGGAQAVGVDAPIVLVILKAPAARVFDTVDDVHLDRVERGFRGRRKIGPATGVCPGLQFRLTSDLVDVDIGKDRTRWDKIVGAQELAEAVNHNGSTCSLKFLALRSHSDRLQ